MKLAPSPSRKLSGRHTAPDAPATSGERRKSRGRPRSFDRDAALERAIEVFWSKGYEGTSISDLTQAMGINPPSLYAAFGDKERLFLEAIERYEQTHASSCPYRDQPTARAAFETLLTYMAEELTSTAHPRGCLMMMAASTASSASAEMQAVLARKRAENRACMKARIELGISEGDVPAGTDAGALSDFYATIVTGMSLHARDGATRKSLLATVERAMALFPPSPSGAAKKRAKRKAEHL
jgi:AcrR family transcriptional regulator